MRHRISIMICWVGATGLLTWMVFAWLMPMVLGAVTVGYSLWAAVSIVIGCGAAAALIVAVLFRLLGKPPGVRRT